VSTQAHAIPGKGEEITTIKVSRGSDAPEISPFLFITSYPTSCATTQKGRPS
jgi:hypothetical protein